MSLFSPIFISQKEKNKETWHSYHPALFSRLPPSPTYASSPHYPGTTPPSHVHRTFTWFIFFSPPLVFFSFTFLSPYIFPSLRKQSLSQILRIFFKFIEKPIIMYQEKEQERRWTGSIFFKQERCYAFLKPSKLRLVLTFFTFLLQL